MDAFTPIDGPVMLTRTLAARGFDEGALRRAVRRGDLIRLTRGAYTAGRRWRHLTAAERYRLRCFAHSLAARSTVVLSHQSAASVLGLPLVHADLSHLHYTVALAGGSKTTGSVHRHALPLPPHHVVEADGVTVTRAARTAADLVSTSGLVTGVAALDHAFRTRLCSPAEVVAAADERGLLRGRLRLERALAFADAGAESPGESLSRVRMHQLGFPPPVLQQRWQLPDGSVAYTDFWWPEVGLIGEFDGHAKYVRHEYAGDRSPAELVLAEKAREDALRSLGPRVTRWGWDTASDPAAFHAHLTRAGLRPTGGRPNPHRTGDPATS